MDLVGTKEVFGIQVRISFLLLLITQAAKTITNNLFRNIVHNVQHIPTYYAGLVSFKILNY